MSNFSTSDLRDPQPPLPGERERALLRRRLTRGMRRAPKVARC